MPVQSLLLAADVYTVGMSLHAFCQHLGQMRLYMFKCLDEAFKTIASAVYTVAPGFKTCFPSSKDKLQPESYMSMAHSLQSAAIYDNSGPTLVIQMAYQHVFDGYVASSETHYRLTASGVVETLKSHQQAEAGT